MIFQFNVNYVESNSKDNCPLISIDTSEHTDESLKFDYSNMRFKLLKKCLHGVQVNETKYEKALLEMCDNISKQVFEFIEKTK